MKNLFLLVICFSISAVLMAQPSILYPENAPIIGDLTQIQFVSPNGLSPEPSGANVSWDFSQLSNTNSAAIEAISPSEAPEGTLFPTANIALKMNDTTYTYGLIDNTGFYYLGAQLTYAGIPITMIYSDSRKFLQYPFTYLDVYTDFYEGESNVLVTKIKAGGESIVVADAYGTLQLPTGTYNDVLRIATLDIEIDSIFVQDIFVSAATSTRTQFHWYAASSKAPLLSMEIMEAMGTTDTVVFYSTTGAGVGELSGGAISELNIFPNPADDHVVIKYSTSQNIASTISIVNQIGQIVLVREIPESKQGSFSENFNISTLPSGIYFANVKCSCGKQLTDKFVIR